ncbi:MAG: hypothetical protein ACI3V0_00350 [Faecousia sp.]
MSQTPKTNDPKLDAYLEKAAIHDSRSEHIFRRILHILERFIAAITLLALVGALAMEIWHMISGGAAYFSDVNNMLHHLLLIVVGLEFVRMLIDTNPSNILEVLTVAITRHVVLTHDDPLSNVACIACIAGLFAIRRFLIRRSELKTELVEWE